MGWWILGLLAVPAFMASPLACGASGGSGAFTDDDDDGTGLSGAAGGGTGAFGGGTVFDAGNGDGALSDGEICEGTSAEATYLPLHMIIVIDRSGSMTTLGYWGPLKTALIAFLQDPLSEGIYVGLNYFPYGGTNDCSLSNWNPVQVPAGAPPMAQLPQDAATLVNNINATGTCCRTPMAGGVEGSLEFAKTLQANYPNDKVIVVLASDGIPNECSTTSISGIANNIVAPAFNDFGIQTYAIAIDQSVVDEMGTIATAGGAQAYDVSQNTSEFTQAMADIRGTALGCEYLIPDQGGQFDPFQVNVVVTLAGGTPTTVPQADNEADCGSDDGWYYDNPTAPTTIILCPKTCTDIQGSQQDTTVEVKYGCPTEVN